MNIALSLKAVLLFVLVYDSNASTLKLSIPCLSQSSYYSTLQTSLNKCYNNNFIDIIECSINSGSTLALIVEKSKSCLNAKIASYLKSISLSMQNDPACFSYYSLIKYTEKVKANKNILDKIKKTYKTSILEDFWLMKPHLDIFDDECPYSSYKDSSDLFEISDNLLDLEKIAGPSVVLAEFFDGENPENIKNYVAAGKNILSLFKKNVENEEKTIKKDFSFDSTKTCDFNKGNNDSYENLIKNITNVHTDINEVKTEIKSNKLMMGVLVDEIRGLINEMKIYNEVSQYLIRENSELKKKIGEKEFELSSCNRKTRDYDFEREKRNFGGDGDDEMLNEDSDNNENYEEDTNDGENENY